MYNQQPTQLDPALQALITLKQRANPTLPNGQPTVAGQMMGQSGMGIAGPNQAMPPQGQQQDQQQGLPSIIEKAQQANPSMQQNAQQGQVDQMAQQVSQRMQQQQQPPGVTGLPASNMGFREGGIVPYADGGSIDLSGLYGRGFSTESASPTPENSEVAAIRARQAEIEALNKARPDFYGQNIAALEADKQARAAAAAAQQKRQGFEGLMALLQGGAQSGMAGMGAANTQFNRGVAERKEAGRQADLLDAQMRVKLGELDYARKIGDLTSAMGVEKDIAGIKRQMDQIAAQREGTAMQGRGYDITAQTAAADREARAKESAANRASQMEVARLGQERRGNAENLAQFRAEVTAMGFKKMYEDAQQRSKYDSVGGKDMKDKADNALAALAAKYNLSKDDIRDTVDSAPTSPAAQLKYNPKTGKVE